MIVWDDVHRSLSLAVQDLLEVDPGPVHAGPRPSVLARARAGLHAHRAWQEQRQIEEDGFAREVQVQHESVVGGWICRLAGRIDGLCHEDGQLVVEELKTTLLGTTELEKLEPSDLRGYCRQIQIYLHLLHLQGRAARGRLVLQSLDNGARRIAHVPPDPGMGAWLVEQLGWLVAAREDLIAHRRRRVQAGVPFAHGGFRPGQDRLAAAVEESLGACRPLLLSAPTGVGKTAAVLLGALRVAWRQDQRVYFATSRGTQQRLALRTLEAMRHRGLVVRALGLRAKARSCLASVQDCHPERCAWAADPATRLRTPGLLEGLLEEEVVWPERVVEEARAAGVCPWTLQQELVDRCDVVVGDYNYVLDPEVALRRAFGERASDGRGPAGWIVLFDEAHNLAERARGWLSPGLRTDLWHAARTALDGLGAPVRPQRELVERVLDAIADAKDAGEAAFPDGTRLTAVDPERFRELRVDLCALEVEYALAVQRRWRQGLPLPRARVAGEEGDPYLLATWSLARFADRLLEAGEETLPLYKPDPGGADGGELALLCRDPGPFLGPRIEALGGTVFLSATLEPQDLHGQLLGLRLGATDGCRVGTPFDPDRLGVYVCPRVSTRLPHRARDRAATAEIIEQVVAAVPGNCAVLFPSHAMRDDIAGLLTLPARERLVQHPDMDDAARQELVDRLCGGDGAPRVLLGVTGGLFAEGVDLPGHALLGVVVVGPALPVVGPEQELIRAWFQARFGDGFRSAYLLPGMTRVVQAAGRVIRTPEDRGVVVLVCQRFLLREYAAFFPEHWRPVKSSRPWVEVARFFAGGDPVHGALAGAG